MGKNKGMLKGVRPPKARANFEKGAADTKAAARKGAAATKAKWARIRTLREAAEAIRGMEALDLKGKPLGMPEGVAATMAMFEAAKGGDSKAYKVLAELMGEMETQVTVKELPRLVDDV